MILIDGKKTSLEVQDEIANEVAYLKSKGKKTPHLAAVFSTSFSCRFTFVASRVV